MTGLQKLQTMQKSAIKDDCFRTQKFSNQVRCSPRIFGKAPPALAAGPRRCGLYTPAAAAGLTKARHWSSLIRQVLELRGLIPNWWRSPAAVPTQRGVRVRATRRRERAAVCGPVRAGGRERQLPLAWDPRGCGAVCSGARGSGLATQRGVRRPRSEECACAGVPRWWCSRSYPAAPRVDWLTPQGVMMLSAHDDALCL